MRTSAEDEEKMIKGHRFEKTKKISALLRERERERAQVKMEE